MFDTTVTVVGTALTAPEWRRTTGNQTLVANFKVASNSRRFDRDSGRWVDGDSLRVRVTSWRRLAEGVASSIMVGDPVIVTGRMYTRDWLTEDGQRRVSYELEAIAVGHDLARGRGTFSRHRATTATSAVEDAESDRRVAGAPTEAVDRPESPGTGDHRPAEDGTDYYGQPADDFGPVDLGSAKGDGVVATDAVAATDAAVETDRAGNADQVAVEVVGEVEGVDEVDAAAILRAVGLAPEAGPGTEDAAGPATVEEASPRAGRRGRSRTAVPV